jgi:hypothetical protein
MVARPSFVMKPQGGGPNVQSGPYTPPQIAQAYGFNSIAFGGVTGSGAGQTIAIVDSYDDSKIQADVNTFDTKFGLPAATVKRVNQTGGTSYPGTDPTGGWELEESLDVEWAHAMAPAASIMLVEASSDYTTDLLTAVQYAASHASVVSMSWGGDEFSGEAGYDSADFAQAGVAYVASSGDSGAPASWPAASPNVLSVGGTALQLDAGNNWSSEVGWTGSGGGPSTYESQPSYQNGVVTQTSSARATPDVAYLASPSPGVDVYDSFPYEGTTYGWLGVGGTSAGAPQWSALLAIADQGRALAGQPLLDSASPQEVMNILYKSAADFHDITSGTSAGSPSYSARPGYDYVTGKGSPIANLVVAALDGTAPVSTDKLVLSAPSAQTAGTSFSLSVTAENLTGATDTGYLGTIHFTSSDLQASLPANFTFSASNQGTGTCTVTFKTAVSQSISATDTSTPAINGTLGAISVSPAPASRFVLSALPNSVVPGSAQSFTVTADDPYGNAATGYAGTVKFTSSDTAAILPANYTFTNGNQGVHGFSVTFKTAGTQSVTVTDINSGISGTQSGITVGLAAPTNLVATAVSTSQIKLTWTGSSGATGYQIQESQSSSTGWTQIGTTSGGITTFQQTGLSAATTYYFRVLATVGSVDSPYSNVASATTSGAAPTSASIWSNSYIPTENADSYGSYEVGVKFAASVAGNVIGVRFYKQPIMGGKLHVGHLWSLSGQLLATATFTNESASGWQQVNFANPVAIAANTIYIASFSASGGYFGITTSFFAYGGVTNGPLQALPNSVSGGNGVYSRTGGFPSVSGNGMNFWADVAFNPSSGSAVLNVAYPSAARSAVREFGITTWTSAQPGRVVTSASSAAPSGPARYVIGSRGELTAVLGTSSFHGPIPQPATPPIWRKLSSSL